MDIDKRWIIAGAVILLVLAWYATRPSSQTNVDGNTSTGTTPVSTLQAKNGDTVSVQYTLRLENGSIYDTSREDVAKSAGIWDSQGEYKPLTFTLGQNQTIRGFEEGIIGMRVGETKNIVVPPEKGYGQINLLYVSAQSRIQTLPRIENVTMEEFMQVEPNFDFTQSEVDLGPWNATILAITNDTVTLKHNPPLNITLKTSRWPQFVLNLTEDEIILRSDPEVGKTYIVPDPSGEPKLTTVREMDNDTFVLDFNPPLAGETLYFDVELVSIR